MSTLAGILCRKRPLRKCKSPSLEALITSRFTGMMALQLDIIVVRIIITLPSIFFSIRKMLFKKSVRHHPKMLKIPLSCDQKKLIKRYQGLPIFWKRCVDILQVGVDKTWNSSQGAELRPRDTEWLGVIVFEVFIIQLGKNACGFFCCAWHIRPPWVSVKNNMTWWGDKTRRFVGGWLFLRDKKSCWNSGP